MYGRELPEGFSESDPQLREFIHMSISGLQKKIRQQIDRYSPQTVFFASGLLSWEPMGVVTEHGPEGYPQDVLTFESFWAQFPPELRRQVELPGLGLAVDMVRAESRKLVLGTVWPAKHVDYHYSPVSDASFKLNFHKLLFHGAIVQAHTQDSQDVDEHTIPVMGEAFSDVEKLRPYLLDAKKLAYAGVLEWHDPYDLSAHSITRLRWQGLTRHCESFTSLGLSLRRRIWREATWRALMFSSCLE
jgi:hypothetical protein